MIKLSRKTMLTRVTMGVAKKVVWGQRVGRDGGGLTLLKAAVSLLLAGDKKYFLDKLRTVSQL